MAAKDGGIRVKETVGTVDEEEKVQPPVDLVREILHETVRQHWDHRRARPLERQKKRPFGREDRIRTVAQRCSFHQKIFDKEG